MNCWTCGTVVTTCATAWPPLAERSTCGTSPANHCGQDGECVTAMVWLHPDHAGRVDDAGVPEEALRAALTRS